MNRHFAKLLLLAGGFASAAAAQEQSFTTAHPVDLGVSYTYLRSNILPGCNCVSLHGGSAEIGVAVNRHLTALAGLDLVHRGGITQDRYAITQLTYTFGMRAFATKPERKVGLFGEALLGAAHVSGTLAPLQTGTGPSNNSFALQLGGGVLYRLSRHFVLRAVQADYVMTTLSNNAADRQNDLRLSSGITYRFGRR